MAEVRLKRPSVGALVRQHARGMAQHVRVHFERHLGLDPDALDHLLQAGHGEGRSPLADEDEGRLGVPLFTAFAHFATQLDLEGVDGLALFTRFHRADIDVKELEIVRTFPLSDSSELLLRLRGVAMLAGRIRASLAISGGVHSVLDVVKATMVGADAVQLVSALVRNGPGARRP
jgi:dihydroorotate dehydrogenase